MIQNHKNSRGITLISMVITIIVLLIILGAISFSSKNSSTAKKLKNLFTDIETLNDSVSIFYIKNRVFTVI